MAETQVAPVQEPIVDLPIRTDIDNARMTGSLKEMLSLAKLGKEDQAPPAPAPQPTQDPTPEPAPASTPEPKSSDRISKAEEKLRDMLFQDKKPKGKQKEAAPEPDVIAPVEPAPAPAPEPAPKPAPAKRVPVKDPAADYAQKLERIEQQRLQLERERLDLERQKLNQNQPAPPQQPSLSALSDEEKWEYEVYGQMDKDEPGKDYQKRFLRSVDNAAAYKAKWEKDNDGEQFNPDDAAHDAFYAKNTVKYDKSTFRKAEIRLAQPEQKPVDDSTKRELKALKLQATLNNLQPRQLKATAVTIQSMLNSLDKDLAKVTSEGGRDELLKQYPAKGPRVMQAAAAVNRFATEAFTLLETDGLVEPNTDKNEFHRLIIRIIATQEPLIASQPDSESTLPDGRTFATWDQWNRMSNEERSNHWHLGAEEVVDIFSQTQSERLKDEFGAIDMEMEAKTKRNGHTPAPRPAPVEAPRPSPTLSSRSVIDTTVVKPTDSSPALDKKLRSILFQRAS